ncbi:M23 family metallopeptidase [Falsirhodobacter sp. 20TX0035]|uniref:M23 family metallopeptidase n=1 Tax=Falsirhodobacter sp. 20TX0035 TaxID=3022019 RepID=UPI0023309581|nr:M23 family metallopeptidase [Falsirhodobacter sp. 20TX0035]MDB6454343.1 peptidoglycan DD-metalloendopeptidase family protein [Falsirhodobacter sp. 20TX0035]
MSKRIAMVLSGTVLLAACNNPMDFDLRNGLNTGSAAIGASDARPQPDARGVIQYPTYQVAVARPGDTVISIATRVGADPNALAQHNALDPRTVLRGGEVISLPQGTGTLATASTAPMAPVATAIQTSSIDVTTLASSAIATAPISSASASGSQPAQHRVQRGETAYSIARTYSVSPKALAEWNGLDANLSLREGQVLMIPTGGAVPAATQTAAAAPAPAASAPAAAPAPNTSGTRFAMPASGSIIRPYQKGKNEGVDIGAPAGSPVVAAADGTVAAITKDTDQVPILVLRHPDNTLTVYAGIDAVSVAKGASVTRGQTVAKIRATNPAFLHFEVRKGFESVDPAPYLQ